MAGILKFSDLHIHSTLRPFVFYHYLHDKEKGSIWHTYQRNYRNANDDLLRFSEADFTSLAKGGVKIAFTALYPLEQNWFISKSFPDFFMRILGRIITHFPQKVIKQIQSPSYNYFSLLKSEGDYLLEQLNTTKKIKIDQVEYEFRGKVPYSAEELNKFLNEETTIIVIPTIEGANALLPSDYQNVSRVSLDVILKNIDYLKQSPFRPFFLTFAHHFYNGLCGHAKSFGINTFRLKLLNIFISQRIGIKETLSEKGVKVIEKLLGIGDFAGEKRILIDVKHMNPSSRQKYYAIVRKHNAEHPDDPIPIIASHAAYSGHGAFDYPEKIEKYISNEGYRIGKGAFNSSRINLTNSDIIEIFKSKGLIGINLDERILANQKVVREAKRIKDRTELKRFWARQILKNISAMMNVVFNDNRFTVFEKRRVVDMFAIGSDFDGFINPVDSFSKADDYNDLAYFMEEELRKKQIFKAFSIDKDTQKVVRKFMFENSLNFLQKHFR